jgi:NAD(P)-dependent dehydrogenase (short-subunit alcohol dehydrogenase family)
VSGSIDAHFACAGVADGTPGIERINFIGHRHQIDHLIAKGQIGRGAAIGFISSFAGAGWEANLPLIKEYLAITDFDDATKWAQENGKADYMFSKLAINAYVASQAFSLLKQGIRINAILPGPTDTPLARANADMWLGFAADYREETGIQPSTPEEQAAALVFLCSDAASAITGFTLVTDAGYSSSGITESFPAAAPVVGFLRGPLYQ